ncbi:MAG TPA: hypothetical protein PK165_03460 [bacterium]|nr:hypothetical protein [bacterium]HPO51874.1 hypothetical protein [bacterium]HXK44513.1 hypothetical protein [bacterium]
MTLNLSARLVIISVSDYMVAPAHSIPYGAKPENIAAMIEVLQHQ